MQSPLAPRDPLLVQLRVDRVRSLHPEELAETVVVLTAAERARPMTGCERRRLVQEEQLRELPGPEERRAPPAAELEPAGDPALRRVAAPDPPLGVVEAA